MPSREAVHHQKRDSRALLLHADQAGRQAVSKAAAAIDEILATQIRDLEASLAARGATVLDLAERERDEARANAETGLRIWGMANPLNGSAVHVHQGGLIPKLRNLDSCCPTLCWAHRVENANQIKGPGGV